MCAIPPPRGEVYSSSHPESGLALLTCLTNKMCPKWQSGTLKARFCSFLLAFLNIHFWKALPWNIQSGNLAAMLWEAQAKGKAHLSPLSMASINCQPFEWRSYFGHESLSRRHMEKNPGIRLMDPVWPSSAIRQPLYLRPHISWSRHKPFLLYLWIPDAQKLWA